jgi:hypothetical protein
MSKLIETQQAYDKVSDLLNKKILEKGSDVNQLRRFQEALDVAFYLLGWAQFEYLVRQEAEVQIEIEAKAKGRSGIAWQYMKKNLKALSVRQRLNMIFNAKPKILGKLHADYDVRNEAAHNYKKLPS